MRRSIIALLGATLALVGSTTAQAAKKRPLRCGQREGIALVTGGSKGVGTLTGNVDERRVAVRLPLEFAAAARCRVRKPDLEPQGVRREVCRESRSRRDRERRGRSRRAAAREPQTPTAPSTSRSRHGRLGERELQGPRRPRVHRDRLLVKRGLVPPFSLPPGSA